MNYEMLMDRALALARKGFPSPNPRVGAVIWKDGQILADGFHRKRGEAHAEVDALENAAASGVKDKLSGATMAVTLEPCCHSGKGKLTPPCTNAIISAGISKVVIGAIDANPKVSGEGFKALRWSGIEVVSGVRERECLELNQHYYYHHKTGRPWVHLKLAQTLDGYVGDGKTKTAITGNDVQIETHKLRREYQAILIGSGTANIDNPFLTVRAVKGPDPLRIVVSSGLDIGPDLQLLKGPGSCLLAGGSNVSDAQVRFWSEKNIPTLLLPLTKGRRVELEALLNELGKVPIISVLVEGGPKIAASFLSTGLVNEMTLFQSQKLLGGGLSAFHLSEPWPGVSLMELMEFRQVGGDLLFRFRAHNSRRLVCSPV